MANKRKKENTLNYNIDNAFQTQSFPLEKFWDILSKVNVTDFSPG